VDTEEPVLEGEVALQSVSARLAEPDSIRRLSDDVALDLVAVRQGDREAKPPTDIVVAQHVAIGAKEQDAGLAVLHGDDSAEQIAVRGLDDHTELGVVDHGDVSKRVP
jgi:hypothetical protein